jgi:hypothetical protein
MDTRTHQICQYRTRDDRLAARDALEFANVFAKIAVCPWMTVIGTYFSKTGIYRC